jgi:LPS sulfotransferase NodH
MTRRAYVLCATPRSGSTLLCSLLHSSGVAGHPESWFRIPNRPEFAADWGISAPDGSFDWPTYLTAAIRAGTSPNQVFGLRLMWNMLGELVTDLGGAPMATQAALLARTFGPVQYLYLSRRDLVAQAISRHKAEVSGTWHLGFEEALHPKLPTYDASRIAAYLAEAKADHDAWQAWFAANLITPYQLTYESLSAAPQTTALSVLAHLGLTAPKGVHATNVKMADDISAEWAARFRAERQG